MAQTWRVRGYAMADTNTVITFDHGFRIRWDGGHNWILDELRDVTNPKTKVSREEWAFCGYYSTLANAAAALAERSVRSLGEKGVVNFIGALNSWTLRATKEASDGG